MAIARKQAKRPAPQDARTGHLDERGLSEARKVELRRVAALGKPDAGMQHGVDLGRPMAVERGQIEVQSGVFIANEPDNKVSTGVIGTRAQRVWAPDRMLRGKNSPIDQSQYDAAVRLFDDFLLGEVGARKNQARGGIRLDPWSRVPYSEARAMRRQSWQFAMKALGPQFSPVVVWCVLQVTPTDRSDIAPTVEAWAKSVGWGTERAVGFLAGALACLAVHYGFSGGPKHAAHQVGQSLNRSKAQED